MKSGGRREVWADALALSGRYLRRSLVGELAEYLERPPDKVLEDCRSGAERLKREWLESAPDSPEKVSEFYRDTNDYLYDLTWWHTLSEDESALAAVEALEVAEDCMARTVLDFGAGIGSLGILLAKNGFEVTLAEINPVLADYSRHRFARRGLTASFLDVTSETLPEAAFDFVSAVDVMEHLPEPGETLRSLAGALRPGGTLYIHLPPDDGNDPRPMHLWHDRDVLLGEIEGAGLWLERADGSSLVLRRGEAPRYELKSDLSVEPTKGGWVLLSERPLMATGLNSGAASLLERLSRPRTAGELASETGIPPADILPFLGTLVEKRVVVRRHEPSPVRWPSVTVVVPAQNRPGQTRECVESLLAVDYPGQLLEVVVVDDASEKPLADALSDLNVRVVRSDENIGQSAARNLAAFHSESEVVAFTDNDCFAEPGWLRKLVGHLCEPGIEVAGGRITSPPPDGSVAVFESVRSPLDMGDTGSFVGHTEPVPYLPTCNLAVSRRVMLSLGGFREEMSLGEDADFVWRVREAGHRIYYEPEAKVLHHHRTRLSELLRRRSDYASSEADLQHRHPETHRQMMIPATVLCLLAVVPVASLSPLAGGVLLAVATAMLCIEFATKYRRLRGAGVRLSAGKVAAAITRQHGASLYHLGGNVARYYGLPLLAASLFMPALLPPVAVLLAVQPVFDHRRLKPGIGIARFTGLYILELSAYQIGVWRGCLKHRTLWPLLPKLRFGR